MSTGKTALSAVATGVYAALTGSTALMAHVTGGVWDHSPQEPAFPLLHLAAFAESTRDTFGLQGRIVTGEIHLWSTYDGLSEVYTILDHVVAVLRWAGLPQACPITATGWTVEAVQYDGTAPPEEVVAEGLVLQHLAASFRIFVTEA